MQEAENETAEVQDERSIASNKRGGQSSSEEEDFDDGDSNRDPKRNRKASTDVAERSCSESSERAKGQSDPSGMEETNQSCGGGGREAGGGGGKDKGESDFSKQDCIGCGASFGTTYKGSSPWCRICAKRKGGGKGGGNGGPSVQDCRIRDASEGMPQATVEAGKGAAKTKIQGMNERWITGE
eukprot:6051599-Prymnesium_polylepis.1